jgi:hypothetical protein
MRLWQLPRLHAAVFNPKERSRHEEEVRSQVRLVPSSLKAAVRCRETEDYPLCLAAMHPRTDPMVVRAFGAKSEY